MADGVDGPSQTIQRRIHQFQNVAGQHRILFDQIGNLGERHIFIRQAGNQPIQDRREGRKLPQGDQRSLANRGRTGGVLAEAVTFGLSSVPVKSLSV